jgi:phospholipid/cholesterol/gamma-HCH transport system substrate-binding protein
MKTRTIEIWVGIFVVLGIVSMLMLALQVSGLSDFYQGDDGYKINAAFKNIGGLKIRSKVTVSGVTIGRVTNITLKQNKFGEYGAMVEMSINQQVRALPKDSSAKILTSGLLGDNYVGVEPGMEEDYLVQGDIIELTSQAVLLEDLISKFAIGGGNEK